MRNMVETNNDNKMMMEEIDNGGNLFDQIDDLLDFPSDGVDDGGFGCGDVGFVDFPPVWSDASEEFSAASDLSAELSVPYEDIVQLEWLSTFVENSYSNLDLTIGKSQTAFSESKDSLQNQFQTSSPTSVLDNYPLPVCHEKRARSKRPRPPTFTPRAPIQLVAPGDTPSQQNKKMKVKILPPSENQNQNQNPNVAPVRKCKHCEITKTPQWRSGPMGPKSLCNACGVRYKKGCLYPEYRPAASPTFMPSLHSNSHKKVLEMRGCVTKPEAPKSNLVRPYM